MYSPLAEVHRADPRWVPWIPILVAVHRTTGSKSTPDHPRALREQLTSASAFDQLHLTSAPRQCVGAKCAYSYQGLALPGRQVVPHIMTLVLTLVNTGTMVLDWCQKAIDEKEPLPRRFQAHMKLLPPCYPRVTNTGVMFSEQSTEQKRDFLAVRQTGCRDA